MAKPSFFVWLLAGLLSGSATADPVHPAYGAWHHEEAAIMGTRVSATFWCELGFAPCEQLLANVLDEFRRLDQLLSPYIPNSELSQVNQQAAQAPVKLSDEMYLLIDKSLQVGELSQGAFDITFASLGQFYDYREGQQPTDAQRQENLEAIDYHWLALDKVHHTLAFRNARVKIDLGGIAKGYAVDRATTMLLAAGIKHASISAGGDSRVLGDRRGQPWHVGIKKPRADDGQPALMLPMLNEAISTSGDYERFFVSPTGERVHHILNPKTGTSASGVVSVSVLAPTSFMADPLSTTVFVMGAEKGLALIESLPGIEAVIIDAHGKVIFSSGLVEPPSQ